MAPRQAPKSSTASETPIASTEDIAAVATALFTGSGNADDPNGISKQLETIFNNPSFVNGVIQGDPAAADKAKANIQAVTAAITSALNSQAVQARYDALESAKKIAFDETRDTLNDLLSLLEGTVNI